MGISSNFISESSSKDFGVFVICQRFGVNFLGYSHQPIARQDWLNFQFLKEELPTAYFVCKDEWDFGVVQSKQECF